MEETLEKFNSWLGAQDRSPRTVSAYTSDLSHFARWFAQTNGLPLAPEVLTPTDVREYRQWMAVTRGMAPATINRRIAALRAYATWAYSAGLIASDPTSGIKLVDEQRTSPRWLDRRQQAALNRAIERVIEHAELKTRLAELEDQPTPPELIWARRDAALIQMMLNAGLRVSEVAALELDRVELRERSGKATVLGKGTKQRVVPLNVDVRAGLSAWLAVRPDEKKTALFVSRRGEPLSTRAIQRVVADLGKTANLDGLTPHMLRHTFAKNLVNAGVGLEKAADLLGHSRLETTRIYTRPGQHDLELAVEAVAVQW